MTKRVAIYCRVSTNDQSCERQLVELREVAKNHNWEIVQEYVENGKLFNRVNYKDGKQDGLWESFYENGKLWSRVNYKDGELDGLWESYYDSGESKVQSCYKNDVKVAVSTCVDSFLHRSSQ